MPCYGLLGVEICIPSLDDIVNAVVTPLRNAIWDSVSTVTSTFTSWFTSIEQHLYAWIVEVPSTIQSNLAPIFATLQTVTDNTFGKVDEMLSSLGGYFNATWETVNTSGTLITSNILNGLDIAQNIITSSIYGVETRLSQGLGTIGNNVIGALNDAKSILGGAIETTQGTILTAFDGMGLGIANFITGVFGGFGAVNVDAHGMDALSLVANVGASLQKGLAGHSPMEPGEAWATVADLRSRQRDYWYQAYIMSLVIEGASLGQIDTPSAMLLSSPDVAAGIKLATDWYAAPYEIALKPLLERFFLSAYQPNIPDFQSLISIYVKEGYLESHWVEFPEEMGKNFQELGFSDYWAKRLWGQHWVYPSPSQLYEMLHRTAGNFPEIAVTDEVLRDMLKLHDFEPKWRMPLEAISWNTWRIFDIRTDWEMGIEDDETVVKRLIDTGYHPKDAETLFAVQKMFVLRSEIDGLLAEADTDFIAGWISEDTLTANYNATPYNQSIRDMRIAKAKLRQERTDKADLKTALINRYVKGDLSQADFEQELSRLGIQQSRISVEVEKANATKLKTVKEETAVTHKALTEATYNRAFKVGLLTEDAYREAMAAYKYSQDDIGLLVELNTPAKPTPEEMKTLTVAELKGAFKVGVITEEEFRTALKERRYSEEDINTIVETEKAKLKPQTAE